ncbi:hypothetical protein [Cellulosimicrobium cellulans]|uniref:restriction endonuclease subunit S n=1 Tax=Cellulosimicrobium cellulans TaxID=1710 RepID=UPI002406182E|nr:hypothetical protein [Cellulosimicrobium cellulans]MDF9874888.1 type I restriction enzyme S subunit [Cellulosimicrobium cellulans]
MKQVALRRVASVRVSNVNKHSVDTEPAVRLCNYTDVYYQPTIHRGLDFMKATATREQARSFALEVGDTVMTKDSETASDIGVSTYVAETVDDLVCGYHLAILRPGPDVHAKYLTWAVRAGAARHHLATSATGMTRMGLTYDAINSTPIPDIPFSDQQRIADFLDTQTTHIDAIIAKRQRQRHVMDTLWRSVVEDAFTAPTGDLVRLSRVADVQSGLTINVREQRGLADGSEVPYLSVSNVKDGYLDLRVVKVAAVSDAQLRRYALRDGDVLMTEGGDLDKLGRGTVWASELTPCLHQNHVFAVRPRPGALDPWYLAMQTQTQRVRDYFRLTASKSTNLASTSMSKVLALPLVVPAIEDQFIVASRLRAERAALEDCGADLARSIELLTEYKQSLITAAVTGEFDVTSASGRGMPGADA